MIIGSPLKLDSNQPCYGIITSEQVLGSLYISRAAIFQQIYASATKKHLLRNSKWREEKIKYIIVISKLKSVTQKLNQVVKDEDSSHLCNSTTTIICQMKKMDSHKVTCFQCTVDSAKRPKMSAINFHSSLFFLLWPSSLLLLFSCKEMVMHCYMVNSIVLKISTNHLVLVNDAPVEL